MFGIIANCHNCERCTKSVAKSKRKQLGSGHSYLIHCGVSITFHLGPGQFLDLETYYSYAGKKAQAPGRTTWKDKMAITKHKILHIQELCGIDAAMRS